MIIQNYLLVSVGGGGYVVLPSELPISYLFSKNFMQCELQTKTMLSWTLFAGTATYLLSRTGVLQRFGL